MAFNASDTFKKATFQSGMGRSTAQNSLNEQLQKLMNPTVQTNLDSLLNEQAREMAAMNESARKLGTFQKGPALSASDDVYDPQFEKSLSSDTKLLQINEMPAQLLANDSSFFETQYSETSSQNPPSKVSPFKPKPISLAPPVPPRAPLARSPTISSSHVPETIQELPV